jgi:transposase
VYRLGKRCAADFIALLDQVLRAFPAAPVIVMICDNDSIHHARTVTSYLEKHPRLELLYGARYSPHDNPVERIWAALKNYVANTAVTWPGRLRQIRSFFRARSPNQMLDTAAPWTSPWLPPGYEQNLWNAALAWLMRDASGHLHCKQLRSFTRSSAMYKSACRINGTRTLSTPISGIATPKQR